MNERRRAEHTFQQPYMQTDNCPFVSPLGRLYGALPVHEWTLPDNPVI